MRTLVLALGLLAAGCGGADPAVDTCAATVSVPSGLCDCERDALIQFEIAAPDGCDSILADVDVRLDVIDGTAYCDPFEDGLVRVNIPSPPGEHVAYLATASTMCSIPISTGHGDVVVVKTAWPPAIGVE